MKRMAALMVLLVVVFNACISACAASDSLSLTVPESVQNGRAFKAYISLDTDTPIFALDLRVTCTDRLKYGSAKLLAEGSFSVSETDGSVEMVCLSSDGFSGGRIVELSFVAEKGSSCTPSVTVDVMQAIDGGENNISLSGCEANIDIIAASSESADEKTSRVTTERQSRSSTASRKSSSSSKRAASSRSSSSSASSNRRRSSSSRSGKRESAAKESYYETHDRAYIGRVDREDDKMRYAVAGALCALSVVGVAFVFYRLGASSRSKPRE